MPPGANTARSRAQKFYGSSKIKTLRSKVDDGPAETRRFQAERRKKMHGNTKIYLASSEDVILILLNFHRSDRCRYVGDGTPLIEIGLSEGCIVRPMYKKVVTGF